MANNNAPVGMTDEIRLENGFIGRARAGSEVLRAFLTSKLREKQCRLKSSDWSQEKSVGYRMTEG